MAEETARRLTSSYDQWTSFLRLAGRVNKYPYHDQLMIFAQRPEATACAEYDLWNNTMRRYVKRGAKGIALIDNSGDYPRLRYIFDVADTGTRANSRPVNRWELQDEYKEPVQKSLAATFQVSSQDALDVQFENIANWLAIDYWQEHGQELADIVADSFLEEYDEDNRRMSFLNAAVVSIKYELLSRCVETRKPILVRRSLSRCSTTTRAAPPTPWALPSARAPAVSSGRSNARSAPASAGKPWKGVRTMMNELTYTKRGDYLIPDLTLKETSREPLGKYGRMRRAFLREHRPILYSDLVLTEQLFSHLREIDETAHRRVEQLMAELLEQNPSPDKKTDQMGWVRHMNALKAQAEEAVLEELISN